MLSYNRFRNFNNLKWIKTRETVSRKKIQEQMDYLGVIKLHRNYMLLYNTSYYYTVSTIFLWKSSRPLAAYLFLFFKNCPC